MNIIDRFDCANDNLYKKNKSLAIELMKLGYPKVCDDIPTACVEWDPERKKIIFKFGEKFLNSIDDDQFAFICCHELLHIFYNHIFQKKDKYDYFMKTGREKEIKNMLNKLSIAQDCVINDSLVFWYDFPKFSDCLIDGQEIKLCFGKDIEGLNIDCYNLTSEDVYDLLPDNPSGFSNEHDWSSFFDENGNLKKEVIEKVIDFIKDNQNNSNFSDDELFQIGQMKEEIKKSTSEKNLSDNSRSIAHENKSLKWDSILSKLIEMRKHEDCWTTPNRNFYSCYPDVILPSIKDIENQEVFVAVDSSGSIDYKALSLFISLIKNAPRHIKIKSISFDTQCYEYDIKSGERPNGGGGTRFDIIEEHIKENFKTYPKCVIVLTDGHGNEVKPKHKDRWIWLLYSGTDDFCKNMKHYNIFDFVR